MHRRLIRPPWAAMDDPRIADIKTTATPIVVAFGQFGIEIEVTWNGIAWLTARGINVDDPWKWLPA